MCGWVFWICLKFVWYVFSPFFCVLRFASDPYLSQFRNKWNSNFYRDQNFFDFYVPLLSSLKSLTLCFRNRWCWQSLPVHYGLDLVFIWKILQLCQQGCSAFSRSGQNSSDPRKMSDLLHLASFGGLKDGKEGNMIEGDLCTQRNNSPDWQNGEFDWSVMQEMTITDDFKHLKQDCFWIWILDKHFSLCRKQTPASCFLPREVE